MKRAEEAAARWGGEVGTSAANALRVFSSAPARVAAGSSESSLADLAPSLPPPASHKHAGRAETARRSPTGSGIVRGRPLARQAESRASDGQPVERPGRRRDDDEG